jgi:hypothetical protein
LIGAAKVITFSLSPNLFTDFFPFYSCFQFPDSNNVSQTGLQMYTAFGNLQGLILTKTPKIKTRMLMS